MLARYMFECLKDVPHPPPRLQEYGIFSAYLLINICICHTHTKKRLWVMGPSTPCHPSMGERLNLMLASGEWRQQVCPSPAWAEAFVPCEAIFLWSGALFCTLWDWGLASGKCSWALCSFPVSQFQGLAMKWIKSLFFSSNAVSKEEESWILYH